MQADGIGDETVVARIGGIDRPTQAMGIPETVRPDFLAGSGHRHERIVVGNSVTAIFAYRARVGVFAKIRNDTKDFSFEGVEPLWIGAYRGIVRFTGGAVSAFEVKDAPVRIAGTSGRIENQVAERMGARIELDA